jgi:P4 family phage/plasmid primase-like protien
LEPPFRLDGQLVGELFPVDNGLLDTGPMYNGGEPKLLPADSNYFVTGKTSYPYDPQATAPLFDQFLDDFTCGCKKTRQLLLESMAYCILLALSFQVVFWLVECGRNAKSVFLHVLRNLVGDANTSVIPLERLGSRFQNAQLLTSRVNIAVDVGEIDKFREGVYKTLADRSPISLERKYRDVRHIIPKTRFFYAANSFPPVRDKSDGFWRRTVIIPCRWRVEKEIPRYEEKLYAELPGILNMVLRAGKEPIARGHFDLPDSCRQAVVEERLTQDTAALFADSCVRITGNKANFVPNADLYGAYTTWAKANGHKTMSNTKFGRAFATIFKNDIDDHRLFRTKRKVSETFDNKTEHRNVHAWAGLLVASFDGEVMTEVVEPSPSPSPDPVVGLVAPSLPVPKKLTAIEREAREAGVSPRDVAKQRREDAMKRRSCAVPGATGLTPAESAELDDLLVEIENAERLNAAG